MKKDDIPTQKVLQKFDFLHNFLTAGIASSVTVSTMAPVERAKLILQVQNTVPQTDPKYVPYKNFKDVITRLVKDQGVLSLWRGNMASVIRCFPYQALNFAFKDKYHDIFLKSTTPPTTTRRVLSSIAAGGMGGVTSLTIVYPLDFARTRMALDFARHGEVVGTLSSTLKKSWKKDRLRGLYRGYPFSIVGVFIYRASYFGIYDTAKIYTPPKNQNLYVSFIQAECAAFISGFISYPFDTVRRTMIMKDGKKSRHLDSIDCVKMIYRIGGIRGFYHGVTVNVLRGTGGALMLVLYDKLEEVLWERPMYDDIPKTGKNVPSKRRGPANDAPDRKPVKCRLNSGLCEF